MIYKVYRRGDFVGCIPRWILIYKPGVFEYEYLCIYRGSYSGIVGAAVLPLDLD